MSDLSKILKEEYDKQKSTITTQSLIEMIEEMMNLQEAFGLVVERTKQKKTKRKRKTLSSICRHMEVRQMICLRSTI